MFYQELFSALNEREVRYMVAGGVAVVLHGALRMTADLDLLLDLEPENVLRFVSQIKERGYLPKAPVAMEDLGDPLKRAVWRTEKGMRVLAFFHPKRPEELLDIFIDEPIPFLPAYGRRTSVRAGDVTVPVVSIPDLIRMKKKSGRPQDKADIQALKRLLK